MSSREFVFAVLCLLCTSLGVHSQYTIPNVEFQALTPIGLRVSIPDYPGIKLFGFHGKVNEGLSAKESGTISGDTLQAKGGRWIFEDPNVQLNVDDVISYWVFVQHDSLGYRKDKQSWRVNQLVSPNTPWKNPSGTGGGTGTGTPAVITDPAKKPTCEPSVTTMNNGKQTCKGQVIFEENFGKLDTTKWQVEQRLPYDKQEDEFASYQPSTVKVSSNKLVISPTLQHSAPNFNKELINTGTLDLKIGCTATLDELCYMQADRADIIPPVISGRISTKNFFSFKYGRIEIKAKVPQGSWFYPELYLEPLRSKYGSTGYESGVIRVAFVRGNIDLQSATEKFDNTVLSGGVLVDQFEPCRSKGIVKSNSTEVKWGSAYHTYGLTWNIDGLTLYVDGETYGQVAPPAGGFKDYKTQCPSMATDISRWVTGSKMAPFDQDFYITLGLGVGGVSDFPDNVGQKMWKNRGSKSKVNFWKDLYDRYETWDKDTRDLLVDSVKVWAL